MEQAMRKWSVTKCWLNEIKCSMEKLLENENTGVIALEKSLENIISSKPKAVKNNNRC